MAIVFQIMILSLCSLWHDVFNSGIIAQGLPDLLCMSYQYL